MAVVMQLNIFDCDESLRNGDCVLRRLKDLKDECKTHVGDLEIRRSGRFYVVGKGVEWEESFNDMQVCYEFVNRNLSTLDAIHE